MRVDRSADGLRGIAALSVFFAHFFLTFFPVGFTHFFPWVAGPDAANGLAESILSLPVVSVFWNGNFAVCVFFVLSGYVLTKPFVEEGDAESMRARAARRYLRLGIPVLASTMLAWAIIAGGGYANKAVSNMTHSVWLAQMWSGEPSFYVALREGLFGAVLLGENSYNVSLWTMRIEFIGSMLIFAYRMLAWKGRWAWFSASLYLGMIISLAPADWPFYAAFLLGSYIGEWKRPSMRMAWLALAVGLAVGGVSGTVWFASLTLPIGEALMLSILGVLGGSLVVYAIRAGVLSTFLESRSVQFLGKISYPFYLLHLLVILSVGCRVFLWAIESDWSRFGAACASFAVALPATVFAAWVFEMMIDRPTIRICRRLTPSRARGPRQNISEHVIKDSAVPVASGSS